MHGGSRAPLQTGSLPYCNTGEYIILRPVRAGGQGTSNHIDMIRRRSEQSRAPQFFAAVAGSSINLMSSDHIDIANRYQKIILDVANRRTGLQNKIFSSSLSVLLQPGNSLQYDVSRHLEETKI
jgi:hypothetical protein